MRFKFESVQKFLFIKSYYFNPSWYYVTISLIQSKRLFINKIQINKDKIYKACKISAIIQCTVFIYFYNYSSSKK